MRRGPLALLMACVVLTPALVAAQSAQEKADAEALFNAGKAALAAGSVAEACPKFAESQRKDPAIGTALYLAECYERSGKIASAWAQFRQAEDMANQRHDSRAPVAKARAERLVPSKLSIVLAAGADIPGLELRRDGEVLSSAQLGLASPVDGGHHVVVASAPGKKPYEWGGDIAEQRGTVIVTIPKLEDGHATPIATATVTAPVPTVTATATATAVPTATATATAPPEEGDRSTMTGVRVFGLVLGGVGLAAIGVGSVFGLVAKSTYDSSNAPAGSCLDPHQTPCTSPMGVSQRATAFDQAAVATGLFIGGSVALVGGLLLFFLAPHKQKNAALAVAPLVDARAAGAMLTGRF